MAQININRPKAYSNMMRSIKILIDGKEMDSVNNGQSKSLALDPGEYKLKAKIDWCGSQELSFTLTEGESRNFTIRSVNPFLGFFYIIFDHNNFLKLKEE